MKSHAQGKKHQSTIQGSQTGSSIKQFFTVKDTATASTSSKSGEETAQHATIIRRTKGSNAAVCFKGRSTHG